MKAKLYLETTILSYLTARPSRDLIVAAHQQITHEWWEKRKRNFEIFISQFVIDEAEKRNEEASPRNIQRKTDKQISLLAKDMKHPSLHTELTIISHRVHREHRVFDLII